MPYRAIFRFRQAVIHAVNARGWLVYTFLVFCCISCGRDAEPLPDNNVAADSSNRESANRESTNRDSTNRETVAETSKNATVQSNSMQGNSEDSSNKNPTRQIGASGDVSSHEGSANKNVAPVHHKKPPPVVSAGNSAPISIPTATEWIETVQRVMDPSNDGWDTELFAEQAGKQLKHLGTFLIHDELPSQAELGELLSAGFSCTTLRPAELEDVFLDQSVMVERPQQISQATVHVGAEGLSTALQELTTGLTGASDKHFKFKVIRVSPADDHVDTTTLFEISGRTASGAIQRSATWKCRWKPPASGEEPRLLSIILEDYEEVKVRSTDRALFSDCTENIFRDAPAYEKQFRRGIDYWRARIENYLGIYYDGLRGLAICDVNSDGLDDIYLCEPGGLPNRLFIQMPNSLLRDDSARSGINLLESTRTALFVDLDNDGDQDMVTAIEKQVQFFSNDGTGRFTREAQLPFEGQTALALAAADFDQDGNIDIYAAFYHGIDEEEKNRTPAPLPYHDARSGGYNRLLRNEGNWKFQDVTEDVGLDNNNDRWSFAAVWEDYDNDGDLDVYVANDFGRNNLYQQENGMFTDVAGPTGAEDINFGMSASFGDYNRDGWMDIYISNMFSSAGGRIAFQPEFQTEGTSEAIAAFQRMSAGNTLLESTGDGSFRDVSAPARVGVGRWAWGSIFADVNNDGWEDILVANGLATGDLPGDL